MRGIITTTDDYLVTVYGPNNEVAMFTDIPKEDGYRKMYLIWHCFLVVERKKGKLRYRLEKVQ